MVVGIFLVLLLLMAAVDTNQLHFSSDEKGTVCEKERREEILQRLKEQEARLQLLYSHWKKDIADLEASQQVLARSILALNRKIQQNQHCLRKVLCLAAIVLFNHGK